ncbi:MAG: DNA-binding protein Alba [Candidatus Helarchaeota archaeon]
MAKSEENVIFIGRKPAMNYVMACFTVIQSGVKELVIKARGKSISKAVDVLEILKNRFMKDQITINNIITGTEQIESKDRGTFSVSTIEITASIK